VDLLRALPDLRRHPAFAHKAIALIGVSAIVRDASSYYFEIGKPKYWHHSSERVVVGIGGIGGGIKQGETLPTCLRREVDEELGARVRIELPSTTYLLQNWEITGTLTLPPTRKRPTPAMIILLPPRLGGIGTPDALAIVSFAARLRDAPTPRDLFGMLRIERQALSDVFAPDEWASEELKAQPGVQMTFHSTARGLPPNAVLRPILTARAFQCLLRAGLV